MFQKCRKLLRNEKGLTLIELLAVVVILGIIAAIAIPSIGSIISKSKDDAHVANAQQVRSAAKLALIDGAEFDSATVIKLSELSASEYLDNFEANNYDSTKSVINVDNNGNITSVYLETKDAPVLKITLNADGTSNIVRN